MTWVTGCTILFFTLFFPWKLSAYFDGNLKSGTIRFIVCLWGIKIVKGIIRPKKEGIYIYLKKKTFVQEYMDFITFEEQLSPFKGVLVTKSEFDLLFEYSDVFTLFSVSAFLRVLADTVGAVLKTQKRSLVFSVNTFAKTGKGNVRGYVESELYFHLFFIGVAFLKLGINALIQSGAKNEQ